MLLPELPGQRHIMSQASMRMIIDQGLIYLYGVNISRSAGMLSLVSMTLTMMMMKILDPTREVRGLGTVSKI